MVAWKSHAVAFVLLSLCINPWYLFISFNIFRRFTIKVTLNIEEGGDGGLLLACYGYPKLSKKAAADSAAEGAIAYLKQEGYWLDSEE